MGNFLPRCRNPDGDRASVRIGRHVPPENSGNIALSRTSPWSISKAQGKPSSFTHRSTGFPSLWSRAAITRDRHGQGPHELPPRTNRVYTVDGVSTAGLGASPRSQESAHGRDRVARSSWRPQLLIGALAPPPHRCAPWSRPLLRRETVRIPHTDPPMHLYRVAPDLFGNRAPERADWVGRPW
jgi:hypothetical protein